MIALLELGVDMLLELLDFVVSVSHKGLHLGQGGVWAEYLLLLQNNFQIADVDSIWKLLHKGKKINIGGFRYRC